MLSCFVEFLNAPWTPHESDNRCQKQNNNNNTNNTLEVEPLADTAALPGALVATGPRVGECPRIVVVRLPDHSPQCGQPRPRGTRAVVGALQNGAVRQQQVGHRQYNRI